MQFKKKSFIKIKKVRSMNFFKHFFIYTILLSTTLFFSCGSDNTNPVVETVDVNGTVNDGSGNALVAVTVTSVNDATNSTATGADGTFAITVTVGDKLSFSKDGFVTQELSAGATLNVTMSEVVNTTPLEEYFSSAGNMVANPNFTAGSIQPSGNLGTVGSAPAGCEVTSYKGAIDPSGTPWYEGWTFYSRLVTGETTSAPITLGNNVTVTDADMLAAGNTVNWTSDNTYVLDGFVFVNDGQTLNIEAGTVIQGKPGEDVNASALVVARGGKINANGTASQPIIFTYEGDQGGTPATLRGQWGGLILLGKASLNSTPGESAIEGIPTNETRGLYGGTDDADNSGSLRYISIRHGGTNIGADNEINGLTLGGVGSGTILEYIEIVGNKDDAIEWFGGTARGNHLISAYCADDGLDYDEGFRGINQFVIVHQDPTPDGADRGGEHDGGTDPETGTPYATPIFCNVTSIGNPDSRTLTFRDNAGGEYHNSIFVNYGKGVDIEDLSSQDQDSYKMWENGLLKLENNVFFNIGAGDAPKDLFVVSAN